VLGRLGQRRLIGGTRGSHLVAEAFEGAPPRAVYAEAGSDGRPFFIIPWNGLYLIGTTDERDDGDPGQARMDRGEYDYLVAETRRLFPGADDLEARVRYTYAGIRPLPSTEGIRAGAITRKHLIHAHADVRGLYSIIGGKLTTHRALAVDCMKSLRRALRVSRRSPTSARPLPGALTGPERDALLESLAHKFGGATARRLWHTYGGRSRRLLERSVAEPELGQRIGEGCELLVVELVHAIENELAQGLVDLLQRRTMIGLNADLGKRSALLVADWLSRLGIWGRAKAAQEVVAYAEYTRRFAIPR
jgi:glycerol-3-phosphate dehydrogenase